MDGQKAGIFRGVNRSISVGPCIRDGATWWYNDAAMSEPVQPPANPDVPPAPAPAPMPVLPVLSYEKPLLYRYKSDLPPPTLSDRIFWRCCYYAGKLLGLVYHPRPAPRLYTPK